MDAKMSLTVLDVYWKSAGDQENKIHILPVNRQKKLYVETDCPEEAHQDHVIVRFSSRESILDNDYKEVKLTDGKEIEVNEEKRYLFEMPYNITSDLLQMD
jgi:actin-related protein